MISHQTLQYTLSLRNAQLIRQLPEKKHGKWPRFQAATPIVSPSLLGSLFRQGVGANHGIMPYFQNAMSAIESDPIKGLIISDVGGMVLPRTAIEAAKRGAVPARETFFREVTGTITNTFLAGWLGFIAATAFLLKRVNAKAMNFRAWIDSETLNSFGDIVKEVARRPDVKTVESLREEFLKTVFSRLESTDNIPNLKEYRFLFPNGGRMGERNAQRLAAQYLGRESTGFPQRVFNVEKRVADKIRLPQYCEAIDEAVKAAYKRFAGLRGGAQSLSNLQSQLWQKTAFKVKREAFEKQKHFIRMLETQRIQKEEKFFLDRAYRYAKGVLTDQLFLVGPDQKPIAGMGVRNLQELLRKTKYFMEEYLNRALADPITGEISNKTLDKGLLHRRLFAKGGKTWFQKNVLPHVDDGLFSFAYKSKYFIVLLPVVLTVGLGCTMVVVNNWLTRRKLGNDSFPGELALMDKMR